MSSQKINLLLYTDKVFHDQLGKLMDYPPQWMQPYDLYRSGYIEENLVAVMITMTKKQGQNNNLDVVEIELFHMGTDPKKREKHLSVTFCSGASNHEEFLAHSVVGTRNSIPKAGEITKIFRDSPYVLQKSVMVVLRYLQSKKLTKKSDFFEKIWNAFELNKKATVPEFMKLIQQLLK